jgi:hypothetical protein
MRPQPPRRRSALGPVCRVCCDPRLREISTMLANGASERLVARTFNYTQATMNAHCRKHTAQGLQQFNLIQPTLERIKRLNQKTLAILTRAEHERDPQIALAAIRESRSNLELIAKLSGELRNPEANANEPLNIVITYVDALPR